MTPKLKFVEGEKVLCFHGPLIYEAKALKSQITKDKQVKYYIHYAGWNKNWDEWVPESRVLKYNDANVQRQKEVFKQHSSIANRKKGSSKLKKNDSTSGTTALKDGGISSGGSESRTSTPTREVSSTNTSSLFSSANRTYRSKPKDQDKREKDTDSNTNKEDEVATKKKRINTSTHSSEKNVPHSNTSNLTSSTSTSNKQGTLIESEDTFMSRIEVKVKIPDELKQYLADDWDAITRQHKLLNIPAKITVQDVVDQYIAYKKSSKTTNSPNETAIYDVLNGIVEYFNVMLGSQLLYKFERPQYAEILEKHPDTPLSKLYGVFHLLRLFVKLGSMLGYSTLDENSMQVLINHLTDFLKFLVKNSSHFFLLSNFVNVSPEYYRHNQ